MRQHSSRRGAGWRIGKSRVSEYSSTARLAGNPRGGAPAAAASSLRVELAASARLALPVVGLQLGLMLMGTVDAAMLGHLSAGALAARGPIGHIVSFTLLIFGIGLLSALDPLVSQAWGAGDLRAIGGHLQRGILLAALPGL